MAVVFLFLGLSFLLMSHLERYFSLYLSLSHRSFTPSFLLILPTHLYLINFDHTVGEWDGEVGRRDTNFGEENFLNKIK